MLWESDLSLDEVKRYSRQIILPKDKISGQKSLASSKVLIVGMGGLGSPVLMYLATTGIQTIGIVDYDTVEMHNLQRQIIHKEENIGKSKTKSACEFVKGLNSSVNVIEHDVLMDDGNVQELIQGYDVVVDCCDSLSLRYILNDACRIQNKDLVCASVLRWEGQICVIGHENACYRCMFPDMKTSAPSCATSGVMGPVCGVIGSLQATEVVKLILRDRKFEELKEHGNIGRLFILNCFTNSFKVLEKKYKICCVCSTKKMGEIKSTESCPASSKSDSNSLPWQYIIANLSNFAVVDIRNNDQFGMFRVAGSFNIPDFENSIQKIKDLKKPVVVSCYKGISSRVAAKFLEDHGIDAYSADRGIEGFKEFVGFHGA